MSHFNLSLTVWAKSQDSVHKPQFFKKKESRSGSNRGPSAYQPSILPLGHTGSLYCLIKVPFLSSLTSTSCFRVTGVMSSWLTQLDFPRTLFQTWNSEEKNLENGLINGRQTMKKNKRALSTLSVLPDEDTKCRKRSFNFLIVCRPFSKFFSSHV